MLTESHPKKLGRGLEHSESTLHIFHTGDGLAKGSPNVSDGSLGRALPRASTPSLPLNRIRKCHQCPPWSGPTVVWKS